MTSTPPPSPQPVWVIYTSTLHPWVEKLHQCALENPGIAPVTQEISTTALELANGDLTLWFGEPPQGIPGYAASLGTDEIVMIAGSEVALRNLNTEQLRELYSDSSSVYQIWTYSEGNELRSIFEGAVLGNAAISAYVLLAPDPAAMLEAVATDSIAIGYVPKSWLTEGIKTISIERELQSAFEHPILALMNDEPEGNLKGYLVCLGENSNP